MQCIFAFSIFLSLSLSKCTLIVCKCLPGTMLTTQSVTSQCVLSTCASWYKFHAVAAISFQQASWRFFMTKTLLPWLPRSQHCLWVMKLHNTTTFEFQTPLSLLINLKALAIYKWQMQQVHHYQLELLDELELFANPLGAMMKQDWQKYGDHWIECQSCYHILKLSKLICQVALACEAGWFFPATWWSKN